MRLGEVIHIFRIANNYSIKELAERMDVSQSYISRAEKIQDPSSIGALKAFADALGVQTSAILNIHELANRENWSFQKTLLETLKIYVGE